MQVSTIESRHSMGNQMRIAMQGICSRFWQNADCGMLIIIDLLRKACDSLLNAALNRLTVLAQVRVRRNQINRCVKTVEFLIYVPELWRYHLNPSTVQQDSILRAVTPTNSQQTFIPQNCLDSAIWGERLLTQ